MRVFALLCFGALSMTASGAQAQSAGALPDTERSEQTHAPGQRSIVELNALAGTFVGLRLKGIVHPARSWDLALEGLDGARIVTADGSAARTERGGGARAELWVSSHRRDAAIIAPGMDLVYLPRTAPSPSWLPPLDYKGRDPALLVEANADLMVLHEFAEHAGVLVGVHGGAVMAVAGHDGSGRSVVGALRPDATLYVGARF